MKQIGIVGEAGREKEWLILNLGFILSKNHKVVIMCDAMWLATESDEVEISEGLLLSRDHPLNYGHQVYEGQKFSNSRPTNDSHQSIGKSQEWKDPLILVDIRSQEALARGSFERILKISSLRRHALRQSKLLFEALGTESYPVVILEYLDGVFGIKELCSYLGLSLKKDLIFLRHLDEAVMKRNLNNEYRQRMSVKGIGREERLFYVNLLKILLDLSHKEARRYLALSRKG